MVVALYRLLRGVVLGRFLILLTTRGRRSGLPRTIAIHYQRHGGDLVVCGSNAGRKGLPRWVHNIRADPAVKVQVGSRVLECRADVLTGEERRRVWAAWIAKDRGYASMQARSDKEFPLVRLLPVTAGS